MLTFTSFQSLNVNEFDVVKDQINIYVTHVFFGAYSKESFNLRNFSFLLHGHYHQVSD